MKFKNPNGYSDTPKMTVQELTEYYLHQSDYYSGEIETLSYQSENIQEFLGRLMQTLADKEILNREEVYTVISGYVKEK